MAVIDILEDGSILEADYGTEEASAVRKWTVTFDTSDDPYKRPHLAATATGIPRVWDRHPYKSWLIVRNVVPRLIGPLFYEVIVYYTTYPARGTEEQFDPFQDPLSQPWQVEWTFIDSNEQIDRDIYGKPLLNSAGESFDPPLTKNVSDLFLRIVRNEADFNPIRADNYKDATNADWFYGFAPGYVLCKNYSGRMARSGPLFYWVTTYGFQMRKGGCQLKIFDAGFRELNAAGDDYVAIKDEEGNPVSQPWPLDGQGRKLTIAQIQAGEAYFREFDVDYPLPFSILGLG